MSYIERKNKQLGQNYLVNKGILNFPSFKETGGSDLSFVVVESIDFNIGLIDDRRLVVDCWNLGVVLQLGIFALVEILLSPQERSVVVLKLRVVVNWLNYAVVVHHILLLYLNCGRRLNRRHLHLFIFFKLLRVFLFEKLHFPQLRLVGVA